MRSRTVSRLIQTDGRDRAGRRAVVTAVVAAALLGLAAVAPARGQAPAATPAGERDKQVAEIQRQIDELSKTLEAIRKAGEAKVETLTPGPEWLKPLTWRSIGPANMGGRVVALAVVEDDPSCYWVATAGGGLLKTVNNGITFEHQFDREGTVAVGDVAVAPSDRNVVWVGTGENNPRNSVSYGDGVYKSTDGGKTWKNMGLAGSFQVGRIAIHPKDPNTVYVGALGRLYGPSADRGLFKTADGGATWQKVLFVDENTGVVDLRMKPDDPETLLAATYERRRDLFDAGDPIKKFGPGGAIHKTTDGGKTFRKLTGGLPTVALGRVGLDYYRKDPNVVFAVVETEKVGAGPRPASGSGGGRPYLGVLGEGPEAEDAALGQVVPGGPGDKAGLKTGDVVKSLDGKPVKTFTEFATALRDRKVGDVLKLTAEREGKAVEFQVTLEAAPAGQGGGGNRGLTGQGREPAAEAPAVNSGEGVAGLGLDPNRPFGSALGGQIENAQDRQGPDAFQTGGVFRSADGGETWARVNSLNPRPFYFSQVRVDPSDEKYVYVLGLVLHRSDDGGKTFRGDGSRNVHADQHALWVDPRDGRHLVLGGDGGFYLSYDRGDNWDHLNHLAIGQFYHVALDPRRPYKVYGGLQDNGTWGGPGSGRPGSAGGGAGGNGGGPLNEDWVSVNGGDGFKCQVDPSDPDLIYCTSQYGVLSRRNLRTGEAGGIRPAAERGKTHRFNWNTPFLLSAANPKIYYAAGEVVFRSLNKGENLRPISPEITRTKRGSATALAESPRDPEVLYAGTDDGALWVTTDGGRNWSDVTKNVGLDRPCYVATIEASRAADGRAYVAFDGHRSDLDDPLVFATEDYGKTWAALRAGLPRGSSHCLREDPLNPDLLYLGTEFALWASLDRGKSWVKANANLPTVAVFEVATHPTAGEAVVATHGRSLWAADVNGLRQLTREAMTAKATLFKTVPAVRWQPEPGRGGTNRRFVGQAAPRGATLYVAIGSKAEKASLKVLDYDGVPVYETRVPTDPGLHRLTWNLNRPAPPRPGGGPGGGGGGRFAGLFRRTVPAAPGTYKVVLSADGVESSQPLKVEPDPAYPDSEITAEMLEGMEEMGRDAEAEERDGPGRGDDDKGDRPD